MGKGDKKTKRGKLFAGSFGISRPRKKTKDAPVKQVIKTETVKEEKPVKKAATTAAKKPAAKKPAKAIKPAEAAEPQAEE